MRLEGVGGSGFVRIDFTLTSCTPKMEDPLSTLSDEFNGLGSVLVDLVRGLCAIASELKRIGSMSKAVDVKQSICLTIGVACYCKQVRFMVHYLHSPT